MTRKQFLYSLGIVSLSSVFIGLSRLIGRSELKNLTVEYLVRPSFDLEIDLVTNEDLKLVEMQICDINKLNFFEREQFKIGNAFKKVVEYGKNYIKVSYTFDNQMAAECFCHSADQLSLVNRAVLSEIGYTITRVFKENNRLIV